MGSAVHSAIAFLLYEGAVATGGAVIGGVAGAAGGLLTAGTLDMPGEVAGVAAIGGAVVGAPIGAQVALGVSLTNAIMNILDHIPFPSLSHALALAAAP